MIEMDIGVAQRFLVALLIGALVGVEREKSHGAGGQRTIAGLVSTVRSARGSRSAQRTMRPPCVRDSFERSTR